MNKSWFVFILFIILVGIFGVGFLLFSNVINKKVYLANNSIDIRYVKPIINKLNKENIFKNKRVGFYLAGFGDNDKIVLPDIGDDISIIWIGGNNGNRFDVRALRKYDYIFVSSMQYVDYLKSMYINARYLPLVGSLEEDYYLLNTPKSSKARLNDNQTKLFGIIDNQSLIEDILLKKNIKYKKYNLNNIDEIKNDIKNLEAVFVEKSNFVDGSLDIHPIFFELALNKVSLFTRYREDFFDNILLFNDSINYYINYDDAEILVEEILNKDKVIEDRKEEAFKLVNRYYSVDTNINRMMNAFHNKKDYKVPVIKNSVNVDVVISVGHITGGDFWLAKDLLEYFDDNKFSSKSITYFDSIDKYNSDFNIVVMGVLPVAKEDYIGNTNVLYIAYPSFEGKDGVEKIKEIDDYVNDIKEKCGEGKGIDAVVSASKGFNDELNKHGIKSYYIPQFTNTKKFYPDYHEELKSDVFFVGVNTNYRRAWKYLKEAGIDVTIYGSNYPEGISNGYYLDNRILRKYYSSAKIVLNDSREGMLKYGFIGNRIFDATACGTLVISDYIKEIEDVYGDSVVMWKTKEELIEKVKYYLDPKNEAERLEKANRAREITLKNFTAEMAAKKFQKVFDEVKKNKLN